MIRVLVEVSKSVARYRLAVQARSIQGALSIVEEHYLGECETRVVFPIEPEAFFIRSTDAAVGLVEIEMLEDAPAPLTQEHTGQRLDGHESSLADLTASSWKDGGVLAKEGETSPSLEDAGETVKDP